MGVVIGREALLRRGEEARGAGETLVFTNGHFDLLHVGHLRYLREARALGDLLVVALNDDESARRLKGPRRPLVPQGERAELLAALDPVDYVVLFDEDSPGALIAALQPPIYVKGGDYAIMPGAPGVPLPEAPIVRAYGGAVRLLPFTPDRSTSGLIARIVERYGERQLPSTATETREGR